MTVLNLSLWLLLIPYSQKKHRTSEMFSFGAFHHSRQSALPFDSLLDTVLTSIFPLLRCLCPSCRKAVVNQIDLRLITSAHVAQTHFLFLCVFIEGLGNSHTRSYTQLLHSPPSSVRVQARLGPCSHPRSYLPVLCCEH